jgi:pSer/pThr/pTyr-binding forkhead associated (FHA) protein
LSQSYYVLEIRDPDFDAERYEISESEVYLGRSQSKADIVVPDLKASGRHCRISFDGSTVVAVDLDSTNGTWFEGARLTRKQLSPGEVFAIGDSEIRLVSVHEVDSDENEPLEATRAMDANELLAVTGIAAPTGVAGSTTIQGVDSHQVVQEPSLVEPDALQAQPEQTDITKEEGHPGTEELVSDSSSPATVSSQELPNRANVTIAFDRSAVPIGSLDLNGGSVGATLPVPTQPGRGRSIMVTGIVLIALSLLTFGATLVPGDELQLKTVEGPGAQAVAIAALSWSSVVSETVLAPYVSGTLFDVVESHYKTSVREQAIAADTTIEVKRRKASLASAMQSAKYASSSAKLWFSTWERVQFGLWAASAMALLAGILLSLGWHRSGIALATSSVIGPLATGQPIPWLSISVAGVFTLLGLVMLAVFLSMRKSAR